MIDELVIELFGWQQVLMILHGFVKSGFNEKNRSIRRFNGKDSREPRSCRARNNCDRQGISKSFVMLVAASFDAPDSRFQGCHA